MARSAPRPLTPCASSRRPAQNELPATEINEDETLWLRTLERYGQHCRHWAIARSAHDIPECPVFHPTAAEFVEPGRYFQQILPTVHAYDGRALPRAHPTQSGTGRARARGHRRWHRHHPF